MGKHEETKKEVTHYFPFAGKNIFNTKIHIKSNNFIPNSTLTFNNIKNTHDNARSNLFLVECRTI